MPLSETIKLASFNVNGLSQIVKSKAIFEKLKKINYISLFYKKDTVHKKRKQMEKVVAKKHYFFTWDQ